MRRTTTFIKNPRGTKINVRPDGTSSTGGTRPMSHTYIRVIVLGPLFFFPFFIVAQSGLDVVITLHRPGVPLRGCGPCSKPQVRGRGAAGRLAAEQLDGQPLKSEIQICSELSFICRELQSVGWSKQDKETFSFTYFPIN